MSRPRRSTLLLVAMISWVLGCSASISAPRTFPVRGSVRYRGKLAAGVTVTFHPQFDIGSVKFAPSAVTGPDGSFTLSTTAPGDGAPPGEYVVTFARFQVQSDRSSSGIETEVDLWKGKYSSPATSTFRVQIRSGDNRLEPFLLD
jgi:hypothetical protein